MTHNPQLRRSMLVPALFACVAMFTCGCGATDGGPQPDGSTGGQASTSSGQSSSSGVQADQLWASVVVETKAGQAPGLIDAQNATGLFITIQLGGSNFFQLGPTERTVMQLGTSDDIVGDLRLGFHEVELPNSPCVFLEDLAVVGPTLVMPGHVTDVRVEEDPELILLPYIATEPTDEAYTALRVRHGSRPIGLKHIDIDVDDATHVFPASVAGLTDYHAFEQAGLALGTITLTASQVWTAPLNAAVDEAYGVTVVIGDPVEDAIAVVQFIPTEP